MVTKPDGQEYEATAQFSMSHFRLLDPKAPIDKKYRIVATLLGRKKEDLPTGSKIVRSFQVPLPVLHPINVIFVRIGNAHQDPRMPISVGDVLPLAAAQLPEPAFDL